MSYDFAVVTPEAAGPDDTSAFAAAIATYQANSVGSAYSDPRIAGLIADVEESGAEEEEGGWVSMWPLEQTSGGLAVPTRYTDPDGNLLTLLRLAARHGLVLVDLSSEQVYRPAPGRPTGVKVGDGTRLGALTYERLASLVKNLPASDPWIVVEQGQEVYAQARRREDGSFDFEYRDGDAGSHFGTILPGSSQVLEMTWAWIVNEPNWKEQAIWDRVLL